MRRHFPRAGFADVIFTVLLLAAIAGGCIGIAVATWQTFVPDGAGSQLAYMYRAGGNPWGYAWSSAGDERLQRTSFSYYAGMTSIPEAAAPDVRDKSFTISAQVKIPQDGAQGMLITRGGHSGGWAFYVDGSKPVFHYNLVGSEQYTIAAERPLAPGPHTLVFAFNYDGGGTGKGGVGTITANGEQIARGRIAKTIPISVSLDGGLDIGEDTGTPVNPTYDVPFKFSGEIAKVTVDLGRPPSGSAMPPAGFYH